MEELAATAGPGPYYRIFGIDREPGQPDMAWLGPADSDPRQVAHFEFPTGGDDEDPDDEDDSDLYTIEVRCLEQVPN